MGLRRVLLLLLLHRNDDRWRLAFISAALVRALSSDACARPRPKPSAYKVVRLPAGSIAADAPVESIHPAFCVGAWASLSTPEARPAPARGEQEAFLGQESNVARATSGCVWPHTVAALERGLVREQVFRGEAPERHLSLVLNHLLLHVATARRLHPVRLHPVPAAPPGVFRSPAAHHGKRDRVQYSEGSVLYVSV